MTPFNPFLLYSSTIA